MIQKSINSYSSNDRNNLKYITPENEKWQVDWDPIKCKCFKFILNTHKKITHFNSQNAVKKSHVNTHSTTKVTFK